jgi:hypothetical protein
MPAPDNLQRSSWKVEAIRRGDLKISGPIPIDENTPLTEEEERRFAGKTVPDAADHQPPLHRPITPDQDDHPPQREDALHMPPPSREPPRAPHVDDMPRDSVVPMSPTPFRETPESNSAAVMKKRRKSGIRNAFRKMFGRKGRDEMPDADEELNRRGHSYHNSVRCLHVTFTLLNLTLPRTPGFCDSRRLPGKLRQKRPVDHAYPICQSRSCCLCIRWASTCRSP